MSRHHSHDISAILSAAQTWQTDCLIEDGTLFGVTDTWTLGNVNALAKACAPQLDGSDRAFLGSLRDQLQPCAPPVVLLCAEMLWVMSLFPVARHTEPKRKRAMITTVAGWSGMRIDDAHPLLGAPLALGVRNPGPAYTKGRWMELAFFIKVLRDLKGKSTSERRNLLAFPWAFGRYLDGLAGDAKPLFTHMLRYLLFPDRFEPILASREKARIVAAFRQVALARAQALTTTQLDRELLKIRKEQVAAHGTQALFFYQEPLLSMWRELEGNLPHGNDVAAPSDAQPSASGAPADDCVDPSSQTADGPKDTATPASDNSAEREPFSGEVLDPDTVIGARNAGQIVAAEEVRAPSHGASHEEGPDALPLPLNQVFRGAPGTGKTHRAIRRAVEICDGGASDEHDALMARYRALVSDQRIRFITLHESYGYADFIEGLRPDHGNEDSTGPLAHVCKPGTLKQMANLARHVVPTAGGTFTFDRSKTIWKMSLGETQDNGVFNDAIDGGFVTLAYGDSTDFSQCRSRESVFKELAKTQPSVGIGDYSVSAIHYFCHNMQPDDLVVIADGNAAFRAIGRITGEYQSTAPDISTEHHQLRRVEWLAVYAPSLPAERISTKQFSQRTLYKLDSSILRLDAIEQLASNDQPEAPHNYVLIIDEMNRGNVARVFGEATTLLEEDKREGARSAITVTLPVSGEPFSLPPNLYLVGTINTALGDPTHGMDAGLRRRFAFYDLHPDPALIPGADAQGKIQDARGEEIDLRALLQELNQRIRQAHHGTGVLGHAYFMDVRSVDQLKRAINHHAIPVLAGCLRGETDEVRRIIDDILPEAVGGTRGLRRWGSPDSIVSDPSSPGALIQ